MKKSSIYGKSYEDEPRPPNPLLEQLARRRDAQGRTPQSEARRIGHMLREEKATTAKLKRDLESALNENRVLKEALADAQRELSKYQRR